MVKCTINDQVYDIDAILFDKDGTLLEFGPLWVAWARKFVINLAEKADLPKIVSEELATSLGFSLNGEWFWDPEGPLCIGSTDELLAITALHLYRNDVPWNEAVTIVNDCVDEVESRFDWDRAIKPIPGLNKFLEEASNLGVKLGVVTADHYESAYRNLKALTINGYFSTIIGHDLVENGKPFPDMFYKACDELNVHPSRVIVFGDSNGDMMLGKNGGAQASIGIVSDSNISSDHLKDADEIINSYDEVKINR